MKDNFNKIYFEIVGAPKPADIPFEELVKTKIIIDENRHKEVNIGQKAAGYLKKCLMPDPVKVDNEQLKPLLLPSWIYFNDYCVNCTDVNLWMLETDFKKPLNAARQLIKLCGLLDLKSLEAELSSSMKETHGLAVNLYGTGFVILIDSSCFKNETCIMHEFTHYVQLVTKQMKLDGRTMECLRKTLNMEDKYTSYMLIENEFWANIYNDFFNGLQKIYWLGSSKTMSWESFVNHQMNGLKINVAGWEESELAESWKNVVKTNIFYLKVFAGISYANPDFYDKIIEKLKNN